MFSEELLKTQAYSIKKFWFCLINGLMSRDKIKKKHTAVFAKLKLLTLKVWCLACERCLSKGGRNAWSMEKFSEEIESIKQHGNRQKAQTTDVMDHFFAFSKLFLRFLGLTLDDSQIPIWSWKCTVRRCGPFENGA